MYVCVSSGTYNDGQQFAVGEVGRDVVRLAPEGLSVPVARFIQPVQPHVGLSCHTAARSRAVKVSSII